MTRKNISSPKADAWLDEQEAIAHRSAARQDGVAFPDFAPVNFSEMAQPKLENDHG